MKYFILSCFFYTMKGRDSRISKEFIIASIATHALDAQITIFEKYLGIVSIYKLIENNTMFCNPLREDDFPTCTFKVFTTKYGDKLWFRDWADVRGYDCFDLVQHMAKCDFNDALELIAHHFSLLSAEHALKLQYVLQPTAILQLNKKETKKQMSLQIKSLHWTEPAKAYWRQYDLTGEDITKVVVPIKCYWYNGNRFEVPKGIGFAYILEDGTPIKIYLPYARKEKGELRFLHIDASIVQGEEGLLYNKDLLLLTSSYKDVLVLRKIDKLYDLNYEVVASMSETTPINEEKIKYWMKRYKNICLYLNNDEAGKSAAKQQALVMPIFHMCNSSDLPKDPSDLVKTIGIEQAATIIEKMIWTTIPPF